MKQKQKQQISNLHKTIYIWLKKTTHFHITPLDYVCNFD